LQKIRLFFRKGVEVDLSIPNDFRQGSAGALEAVACNPAVSVEKEGDSLVCKPVEGAAESGAMSGTMRAVAGQHGDRCQQGFERKLTWLASVIVPRRRATS
jgi:large subunit ribosomal protein L6